MLIPAIFKRRRCSQVIKSLTQLDDTNPSSTVSRVINTTKSPLSDQNTLVYTCKINGKRTLIYQKDLRKRNKFSYQRLVQFAKSNNFDLKENQRKGFCETHKDRYPGSRIIMVLGMGFISQTVFAADSVSRHQSLDDTSPLDKTDSHQIPGFNNSNTMDDMIVFLLDWINSHSAFNFDIDKKPAIKLVSAGEITEIAFAGDMPKSLNVKEFTIYGLYNFHEQTIYLLDSVDLGTDKGRAILLHELVHFLQYHHGQNRESRCRNELEALAYMLEAKYLDYHEEHHDIDNSHIARISSCST